MRYYIGKNGAKLGPFEAPEIRVQLEAGVIAHDDLLWRPGLSDWIPVHVEFPPPEGSPPPLPQAEAERSRPLAASLVPEPDAVPGETRALVLGWINLLTWLIPLIGLPLAVWGLVSALKARRAGGRGRALLGLVLNALALALTLINAAIGAYLGATGQHPLMQ
jgi:hypothetical protein